MTPFGLSTSETLSPPAGAWFSTRVQIALATCACACASAFVYAVDPNRHAVYPQCLLYNATGIYCAGCGATRAFHALLHGRVLEALHDNALFIAALPLILYVAASYALSAWRGNAWPQLQVQGPGMVGRGIGILVLLFGFMILRNLPGWPFDWLKPLAG
jgi:hypothetical protein